ncbi:hypothetical protein JCM11491_002224 [Sporobolomyces phaffii]
MASVPTGPPKLVNRYNLRRVGAAKACFICSKETVHCLANDDMSDWMYVCHSHVLDPAFARPAPAASGGSPTSSGTTTPPPPPASPPVPQSEIDKVKREYEEKLKRKSDAAATPPASTSTTAATTTTGKAFSVLKSSVSTLSSLATTATAHSSTLLFPPPAPVVPSPSELLRQEAKAAKVFALNRTYFDMRVDRKKREWHAKDAKERSKQWAFPKVPQGGLPSLP